MLVRSAREEILGGGVVSTIKVPEVSKARKSGPSNWLRRRKTSHKRVDSAYKSSKI